MTGAKSSNNFMGRMPDDAFGDMIPETDSLIAVDDVNADRQLF
jgi:hypothetical protein